MMLLFSPGKRCPCPCSDAVVLPPSGLRGFVRSGCAGAVGAAVRGRAGRGGGGEGAPGTESIYAHPRPVDRPCPCDSVLLAGDSAEIFFQTHRT